MAWLLAGISSAQAEPGIQVLSPSACNPDDVAIVNNGGGDEYWVTCSGSNEVLVVR